MPRQIEQIYQDIANMIGESIHEPWAQAWIIAKMEDDNAGFEFEYQRTAEAPSVSFADEIEPRIDVVYMAFKELRQAMKESSGQAWNTAKVTLEQGGEFKINFGYD